MAAAIAAAVAGCGKTPTKRACVGGSGADSSLVTDAALVRLDVYDGSVHCVDDMLEPGAPQPTLSRNFTKGQPIKLDVPPGPHTLVLTTFSDDAGSVALGTACTETTVEAGADICFDLTLVPAPPPDDLSVGPPCSTAPDSCPKGMYCDGNNCLAGCKVDGDCSGADGVCNPTTHQCAPRCYSDAQCGSAPGATCCNGYCTNPQSDVNNCGGCGIACSTPNATAACTTGLCTIASCNSGWYDCDGNAANGCEAQGPATGPGCCNGTDPATTGTAMIQHNNGFPGGVYYDCYPVGTPGTSTTAGTGYNANMAQDAANSYTAQAGTSFTTLTCGSGPSTISSLCKYSGTNFKNVRCTCWAYSCGTSTQVGTLAACEVVGHVFANLNNTGCLCVVNTDPSWN